ncbi:hypothetical protein [Leeuwenhoekiella sp. W20_SRS_FM14]|uniref:hypothetical protein n=1 Tax=Leeuwenhoekiella sp. W20_SRS_FM14 TaxID=3240270 RepID=UPI003F9BA984
MSNQKHIEELKLVAGCYGYDREGTTITFRILRVDPLVQGTLIYNWAEKDRNSGSFEGTLDDDIILGTYTFISEGIESTREVAFKIDDTVLLEGFGEVTNVGTTTVFRDKASLKFIETIPLELGKCLN